jgi:hypothetical protein
MAEHCVTLYRALGQTPTPRMKKKRQKRKSEIFSKLTNIF